MGIIGKVTLFTKNILKGLRLIALEDKAQDGILLAVFWKSPTDLVRLE